MDWIEQIKKAVQFMEDNLTNDIGVEDVSKHVYVSKSHFQRVFHAVTGITVSDYIRNRRLSLAGLDLLMENNKVIDIAMRYQYDTSESFSKAFARFHGFPPSLVKRQSGKIRFFDPISVDVMIQGGFNMSRKIMSNGDGIRLIRESFEYKRVGRLRFIGIDCKRAGINGYHVNEAERLIASILDPISEKYACDITDYCMLETRHGQFVDDYYQMIILGKFFLPDTPLPELDWEKNSLYYYDIPTDNIGWGIYSGDETFGGDPFDGYVFTRDQIMSDGVEIPYPRDYWTVTQLIEGEPRKGRYRFGFIFGVGDISGK